MTILLLLVVAWATAASGVCAIVLAAARRPVVAEGAPRRLPRRPLGRQRGSALEVGAPAPDPGTAVRSRRRATAHRTRR